MIKTSVQFCHFYVTEPIYIWVSKVKDIQRDHQSIHCILIKSDGSINLTIIGEYFEYKKVSEANFFVKISTKIDHFLLKDMF